MKSKISLLLFFTVLNTLGQTATNINPTIDAIEKYFELTRENVQLSLNKNSFISGENIWFKGTVVDKKTLIPNVFTTNVLLNLVNSDGKILETQLVFADKGIFSGQIIVGKNLPSGKYYLQVFTNFMNNFSENESTQCSITIYNPNLDNFADRKSVV